VTCSRSVVPGTLVSYTNKTDRHDITEIVLIVTLNTITLTLIGMSKFVYQHNLTFLFKYLVNHQFNSLL